MNKEGDNRCCCTDWTRWVVDWRPEWQAMSIVAEVAAGNAAGNGPSSYSPVD